MKLAAGITVIAAIFLFSEKSVTLGSLNPQDYTIALPLLAMFILLGARALFARR